MQHAIQHGWVHKTDESTNMGKTVAGAAHYEEGTIGSSASRVHLDAYWAFVSYSELSLTFRHEVAHIYGYGNNGNDSEAENEATACSP